MGNNLNYRWEPDEWNRETFEDFVTNFDILDYDWIQDEEGADKIDFKDTLLLPANRYRDKNWLLQFLSLVLYFNNYEDFSFKPMLLTLNFPVIQQNCDALGIELPPIPRTKDYIKYMMYYWDICVVWNEFQIENELSDAELCACIYDYARMLSNDKKEESVLPKPTNIWLVGAAKGDFDYLDSLGQGEAESDNELHIWQCNERTRRGDLIVMYCRSPRSYIHSIWRASSAGIFNPFDFYQCRTRVCDGVKIPNITIKELKEDSYLSQIPIVRKNLQGVNGVELSAKDYSEIQRFIKDRGDDISMFPKLFECETANFGDIKIEKDVEEKILIPFLRKIGYQDNDWTRQLSQKAGRGLKAIPDFVFFPKGEKHFESAPLVIEAKYDMFSMQERSNAFSQCLSYARMMRSKLMAICDKERMIVYALDSNGSSDRNCPIFEDHWVSIFNDEQVGNKLHKIIGKENVVNL